MILIDTHIWIWWVCDSELLKKEYRKLLDNKQEDEILVSNISVWEVAKAVEKGKLQFNISIEQWFKESFEKYFIKVIPLDVPIILESTRLPGNFHKDPADQLIVSTSRVLDIPLLTADTKILSYPFVKCFSQ